MESSDLDSFAGSSPFGSSFTGSSAEDSAAGSTVAAGGGGVGFLQAVAKKQSKNILMGHRGGMGFTDRIKDIQFRVRIV